MFVEQRITVGPQILNVAVGDSFGSPIVLLHGVVRCWQDFATVLPVLGGDRRCSPWTTAATGALRGLSVTWWRITSATRLPWFARSRSPLSSSATRSAHSSLWAWRPRYPSACVRSCSKIRRPRPFLHGSSKRHMRYNGKRCSRWRDRADLCETALALAEVRLPGGLRMGDLRDGVALRFLARCLRDLDPAVLTPVLEGRWLIGFDPLGIAAQVRCPALLLAADVAAGGMLPGEDADALANALGDSIRIDLPKVGHLIRASCPDVYLRHTLNFLDSLEPPATRP